MTSLKNYFIIASLIIVSSSVKSQQVKSTKTEISFSKLEEQDFSFLKKSLQNKQIVLIGESSHGVLEFGEFKKKTVAFLVDSLGFSAVFIESGFSDILKWTEDERNSDSLIYALFPVWHTNTYLEMLQYLKKKGVKIFGIDPQNSSRFFYEFPYRQLIKIDKDLATSFYKIDKEWSKAYSKPVSQWDSSFYASQRQAIDTYASILSKLNRENVNDLFLKKVIENRLRMAKAVAKNPDMFHRDSIMKENVDWLLKNVLTEEDKVIILSHNVHIAKEKSMNVGYLGFLINKQYGDKTFAIAQYFASGKSLNNRRELVVMPAPAKNSLESYLNQLENNYQIFDMNNESLPKQIFDRKINTYYMGGIMTQSLILSENFDMIFTVRNGNHPTYID